MLAAGARVIHVDVMDGHFVPPITMGPLAVEAIAEQVHDAGAAIDVHLMIERPERQVEAFAKAGADSITVHVEATPHVHYALQAIARRGLRRRRRAQPRHARRGGPRARSRPGPVHDRQPRLGRPGVPRDLAGQARAPARADRDGPALEVDGGIDAATAARCAAAGATVFVAGTAVFGAPDPAAAVKAISAA